MKATTGTFPARIFGNKTDFPMTRSAAPARKAALRGQAKTDKKTAPLLRGRFLRYVIEKRPIFPPLRRNVDQRGAPHRAGSLQSGPGGARRPDRRLRGAFGGGGVGGKSIGPADASLTFPAGPRPNKKQGLTPVGTRSQRASALVSPYFPFTRNSWVPRQSVFPL